MQTPSPGPAEVVWSLPALSIRQPWAWLVAVAIKDVENRNWSTLYRGAVLIHASSDPSGMKADSRFALRRDFGVDVPDHLPLGGIVGVATIADCVRAHPSKWASRRRVNWVMTDANELPFRRCKGALGLFQPSLGTAGEIADLPLFAGRSGDDGSVG